MNKKNKNKLAQCPSCLNYNNKSDIRRCISILEKLESASLKQYKELGFESFTSFINSNFSWACDSCLQEGKATLANPALQETPWTPHLAYFDSNLNCYKCQKEFVFSKEEKKIWYESYKLPLNAEPNNCLDCRRAIRLQKNQNKELSDILQKKENQLTTEELAIVIRIYEDWGKTEKVKFYQSLQKKFQKATKS